MVRKWLLKSELCFQPALSDIQQVSLLSGTLDIWFNKCYYSHVIPIFSTVSLFGKICYTLNNFYFQAF